LAQYDNEVDNKFLNLHAKFETNSITLLIDMLLSSPTSEDGVAMLSHQSNFHRSHLLCTLTEISYFIEFFRILMGNEDYDINKEDRDKLQKILNHLPANLSNGHLDNQHNNHDKDKINGIAQTNEHRSKDLRSKQVLLNLGKSTKNKIAKTMSFSTHGSNFLENNSAIAANVNGLLNGTQSLAQGEFSN